MSLVRLHGGTISVASGGPRQGSEFEVRLPVARFDELDDWRFVVDDQHAEDARRHR